MRLFLISLGAAALASSAIAATTPTYYKDVLPVLQKNCQTCHRPGEAAPMQFMSYESTRPWAKAIKTAVATKKMPPWFADPSVGHFANDRTLSAADIATLVAWADNGAEAGNPADAPAPVKFAEGWRIGTPDVILKMPQAVNIPASGTVDYQYVIIPTNFTEDKYVKMAEARPGDPSVVHHILAFIREPGSPWLRGAPVGKPFSEKDLRAAMREQMKKAQAEGRRLPMEREGGGADFGDMVVGYAPGTLPTMLKDGQVKLVPAGSDIILQMHYTSNGKASTDISEVGMVFTKDKGTERVLTLAATTNDFLIPAGAPDTKVVAKMQLQDDSTLQNLLPHMHFRGKSFSYKVIYPTGESQDLLKVPNYDFNWQLTYDLTKPIVLPKGSVIEAEAHYDNSINNKFNPDPKVDVRFGEQSWEEMMFGFFDVSVPLNKSAIDVLVPEDKRPKRPATGAGN